MYAAQNRHSKQCEVADDVHDLVTHKLIPKSKPIPVHYSTFRREDDRIFKGASSSKTQVAQCFHFFKKAKRSRGSNLSGELPVGQFDLPALSADHGMRKLNQAGNRKGLRGTDAHAAVVLGHFDVLQHSQKLARGLQRRDPSLLNHLDERLGAAVSYRNLERVYINDAVVNLAARQRRKQVLDGRYHHTLSHQRGRVTHSRYKLRSRW